MEWTVANRTIAIRLSLEDADKVRAGLKALGDDGDAALLQALANLLDHRDIGSDDEPQRQSAVSNCL